MSALAGKRYWLIGASEGLGRALATQLDAEGVALVLSARNRARIEELSQRLRNASALPMDVTDAGSVAQAASAIGEIDGVIYNAGGYDPMRATQWNSDQALAMCDVNYLGAIRVMGELLPGFIARTRGDITFIGSLAGYRGLPGAIGYGASKSALISLAETMRFDLKNSGVTVRVVNPGFIKTRLTGKNDFAMPMLMEPEDAAERVIRAMKRKRFRTDFPFPFSTAIKLLNALPDAVAFRLLR